MSNRTIPAVSIIIPMYNVEKYIGECLESILAQTFQDFEVIVVDDCSTDNSRAVVESYIPKFNGEGDKLNLICSDKNSGGHPGISRNIGIRLAMGEYIMFIDSDDGITNTALEELYPIAKKFDADVVYCEKFYKTEIGEKFTTDKKFLRESNRGQIKPEEFVKTPVLIPEQIDTRIEAFGKNKFWTACWNYLFRRKLIMRKNITFPLLHIGEDELFDFQAICFAKNIIRVPNIIYIWRTHEKAFSREILSPEKYIERWANTILKGIWFLDEFMDTLDICREHLEYKYLIFENFITRKRIDILNSMYAQIPAHLMDGLIRRELAEVKDKTALTSFLFSRMNIFNVNFNRQGAMIQQMQSHIQQQNQVIKQQQEQIQQLQAQLNK